MKVISKKIEPLVKKVKKWPAIRVGVICPQTKEALAPVFLAAEMNLITPVLLGSVAQMSTLSKELGQDLSRYESVDLICHDAVHHALHLVHTGNIQAIMKGSLHTSDFMRAVVNRRKGLCTARRITHCMVMDLPAYPKLLMITDCAFNVLPTLTTKRDIVQNAIDFAKVLGIETPKVALLSSEETISEHIPSTLECARIKEMWETGEIQGGIVDGPLSFDVAMSHEAAAIKNVHSHVAGDPDILVVPNLDVGNVLFKTLRYFANAETFGLGLGAQVPIILTSRAASVESRLGSCVLAKFYINRE